MTQGLAVPCTVKTFKPMHGFGTLVLEGGEELSFDISACDTRNVQEGARGTERARADRTFLVPEASSHARHAQALVEGLCAIIGEPDFCTLKLKNAHTGVLIDRSGQQHKVSVGHGDTVVTVINGLLEARSAPARVHTRKLFGTPWFVFREGPPAPGGIAAALFLP